MLALFLRLGVTGFGGPVAHVALMDAECVRRRGWVTPERFADLLSASNVLPGPGSTELAMQLGAARAGWPGLLVAGTAFILPSTMLVWLLAWWYQRIGARPEVAAVLTGMQPVVLAVVAHAVWRLGRSLLRSTAAAALAVASLAAILAGAHELLVLAGAALAGMLLRAGSGARGRVALGGLLGHASEGSPWSTTWSGAAATRVLRAAGLAGAGATLGTGSLFLTFLKLGAVTFGSGYVLLAFLRREFVERQAVLTEGQLLDAVAIGQVTPGPVFTTATFVGYLVNGHAGAVVATLGIFLPAFLFAAGGTLIVHRVRRSPIASAALDGVNSASLALMTGVVLVMARSVAGTTTGAVLAIVALGVLLSERVGAGWLLVAGAFVGLAPSLFA